MIFSRKNLIILGAAVLLLVLTVVLTSNNSKKNSTVATTTVNNKDFDTKEETPTPTLTPTPTKKPTLVPTLRPTSTPIPTIIPTATNTPIPTKKPTRRPTRIPTATPTPDTNIYATGVVLDITELDLAVNESHQVGYRVEPNDTTDQTVYWSSSSGDIALVTSDGWIVGKSVGEAIVTARTSNNKTTSIRVRVGWTAPTVAATITPIPTPTAVPYPTRIDLSLARLILKVGETKQLYVKYQPENIVNKTVTWTTSNSSVITVSKSGLVKGIKVGTSTIKVVSVNKLSGTATVVVSN